MTFAVVLEYDPTDPKIAEFRPAHRAYLGGLKDEGKLVLSGPFGENAGGLVVYEAPSLEATQELVANDPFTLQGVTKKHTIRQWTIVVNTTKT